MAKLLAILAFLTVTINPVQKNQSPNQPNNHCDDKPAPIVSVVSNRTYCPNQSSPNDELPWWKEPEWWLCILGIPSLVIIGWQARAAKVAADAIMHSERAWLLLDGEKIGMPFLRPVEHQGPQKTPVHCRIALKNCGNTPATAIDWQFELRLGDSAESPPSFDIYKREPPKDRMTPFPIGQDSYGNASAVLTPQEHISASEMTDIWDGKKVLWLCGIARYHDVFKQKRWLRRKPDEHYTFVCLRYICALNGANGQWVLGGPSGYNRAE